MEQLQSFDFKNPNEIIKSLYGSNKAIPAFDKKKIVTPATVSSSFKNSWLGCMSNAGRIVGDIISPAEKTDIWDVLSE